MVRDINNTLLKIGQTELTILGTIPMVNNRPQSEIWGFGVVAYQDRYEKIYPSDIEDSWPNTNPSEDGSDDDANDQEEETEAVENR